jgi:hypothetical protein
LPWSRQRRACSTHRIWRPVLRVTGPKSCAIGVSKSGRGRYPA